MQSPLDPYQQWLGIPPAEQPPNHYRLLGVRQFESDPEVIRRAASGRIAQIYAFSRGGHHELVQALIARIHIASDVLTDRARKAQYDGQLQAQAAAPLPVQPVAMAIPVSPPATDRAPLAGPAKAAPMIAVANGSTLTTAGRNRGNGSQLHVALLVGVAVIGVIGLAGLLMVLGPQKMARSNGRRPEVRPQASRRLAADSSKRRPRAAVRPEAAEKEDDAPAPKSSPSLRLSRAPMPNGPTSLADLLEKADDSPANLGTVTGDLAAARQAMAHRDLEAAQKHIEAARRAAHAPREKDEVERLQKMLYTLQAFWKAVHEMFGHLRTLEELKIDGQIILVAEADKDQIILRSAGRNQIYGKENLPGKLAIYLAERGLAAGEKTRQLCFGTFHALDAQGNRQEARRCFQQAGAEGQAFMAEIE